MSILPDWGATVLYEKNFVIQFRSMTQEYSRKNESPEEILFQKFPTHYYGDIVRKLFILAGAIMIIGTPFFKDEIAVPLVFPALAVVAFALIAGITNPRDRWAAMVNVAASAISLVVFEAFALGNYQETRNAGSGFFVATQALAIIFFFALYFSTKTLRGRFPR